MSKQSILSRIKNKEVLVADGSTGMTLITRGLPTGKLSENWVIENPQKIIQLHSDFIHAGADIILTCTFNATPIHLKGTSLEGKTEVVNQTAVELARTAIGDTDVYIAGSLGPVGQLIKPLGPLTEEEVSASYAEQAQALHEAGVDLMVIETQFDIIEMKAAIQGVRSVSNLPLVASFSYDRGRRTMMGVNPTQASKELGEQSVDIIGINCGHSLEENLQNLIELRSTTKKPVWFKPNAGLPHLDPSGRTRYDVTPKQMGSLVPAWLAAGAQIVGGCCGTSPDHLAQISRQVIKH